MRLAVLDDRDRIFVEYDYETIKKLLKEYVQTMNTDDAMDKMCDELWAKVRRM